MTWQTRMNESGVVATAEGFSESIGAHTLKRTASWICTMSGTLSALTVGADDGKKTGNGRSEMKIELSHELESMLISSVRYALGRRTYIVSQTVDYLIPLLPYLSEWFLRNVLKDLGNQIKYGVGSVGDPCDFRDWARLWARIGDELKEREEAGD